MKKFSQFLDLGIFIVGLFSSCAKQPTQAIDAAKAAIEAATKEGASVYAADELKKLNNVLSMAVWMTMPSNSKLVMSIQIS